MVFLSLGETDEAAHEGRYDAYLQRIAAVDRMIADLWYTVQTDEVYKNKTVFLISTDHGRGRAEKWTTHHTFIRGSGEIWLALLGKGIEPVGELQSVPLLYQNQVAATTAFLLGEKFISSRPAGAPVSLPLSSKEKAAQTTPPAVNATVSSGK